MTLYPEDVERYGQPTDEPTEADPLIAAIDAHIAKGHEPLAVGKDPVVSAQLYSEDSVELLLKAADRLRALVGGRSAAPTREQVRAAVDSGGYGPLGPPPGWEGQANSITDAVVALLSRSAEPPEDDDIGRLRRERDSLARRCSVRFEETEAAVAVVRQYAARWTPDLDTGLWWRNDLRTSRPITSSEMVALRRALDDDGGVAAEPNEEHGDGA